jgi:hypothetical protein
MSSRKILLAFTEILIIAATLLPSEASERKRAGAYEPANPNMRPQPAGPGYFGIFGPNAYDYEPFGYGTVPPSGYGFPPYGFGCLQRTVVLTLFGPRIRQVWVCG